MDKFNAYCKGFLVSLNYIAFWFKKTSTFVKCIIKPTKTKTLQNKNSPKMNMRSVHLQTVIFQEKIYLIIFLVIVSF